jgi:hypothetical protein
MLLFTRVLVVFALFPSLENDFVLPFRSIIRELSFPPVPLKRAASTFGLKRSLVSDEAA